MSNSLFNHLKSHRPPPHSKNGRRFLLFAAYAEIAFSKGLTPVHWTEAFDTLGDKLDKRAIIQVCPSTVAGSIGRTQSYIYKHVMFSSENIIIICQDRLGTDMSSERLQTHWRFSFASGLCGYSTTTIEHVVAAGYRAIYNGPPPLSRWSILRTCIIIARPKTTETSAIRVS